MGLKTRILIIGLLLSISLQAQITDTAVLRNYINANIVPNGTRSITATQLNTSLIGLLNVTEAASANNIYNTNGTLTGSRDVTLLDNQVLRFRGTDLNRYHVMYSASTTDPSIYITLKPSGLNNSNSSLFRVNQILFQLFQSNNIGASFNLVSGIPTGGAHMSWVDANAVKYSYLILDSAGAYLERTTDSAIYYQRLRLADSTRGMIYEVSLDNKTTYVTKVAFGWDGAITTAGKVTSGGVAMSARSITANYTTTSGDHTIINTATTGNPTITLTGGHGTEYTLVEEASNPTSNGMVWTPAITYKGATYTNANNPTLSAYSRFTVQNVGGTWYLTAAN